MRILQLSDGRFVLGQQTFSEADLVERYQRGDAVLIRDDLGRGDTLLERPDDCANCARALGSVA